MRIRDIYEAMRDKVFGRTRDDADSVPVPKRARRLDQGPATRWYVKRCFPRGVFTKALTPCRIKQIRDVMRYLRPDQQAIARRYGYTKGMNV